MVWNWKNITSERKQEIGDRVKNSQTKYLKGEQKKPIIYTQTHTPYDKFHGLNHRQHSRAAGIIFVLFIKIVSVLLALRLIFGHISKVCSFFISYLVFHLMCYGAIWRLKQYDKIQWIILEITTTTTKSIHIRPNSHRNKPNWIERRNLIWYFNWNSFDFITLWIGEKNGQINTYTHFVWNRNIY